MRSSSKLGLLFLAVSLLGIGCAPRISTNLYARWGQQDQIRRTEMAQEEKIRAEVERRMGKVSPAANGDSTDAERPALRAPASSDEESGAVSTPPITGDSGETRSVTTPPIGTQTATASRAVKPLFKEMEKEEEEEETIY